MKCRLKRVATNQFDPKYYSHLCQVSGRPRPGCDNTIPQHRQSRQAEDLHPHCHRGHEAQEDAGAAAQLPVLEAGAQEDAGQGEQGAQVGQAEVEKQDGAGLGAAAGVPHQDQPQQEVTANPHHQRDQTDHGEHHGEGDGGVGGDRVEQEVDDGRHGAGRALGGTAVKNMAGMENRRADGEKKGDHLV